MGTAANCDVVWLSVILGHFTRDVNAGFPTFVTTIVIGTILQRQSEGGTAGNGV